MGIAGRYSSGPVSRADSLRLRSEDRYQRAAGCCARIECCLDRQCPAALQGKADSKNHIHQQLLGVRGFEQFGGRQANAIDYLILRVFNSYGGDDKFSVVQKLISCARDKRPFTLLNEGIAERDFIHVDDVAKVVCALTEMPLKSETINVGSGRSVRIIDLLHAVEEKFGKIAVIAAQRPGEAIYSRANINKLRKLVSLQTVDIFDFIRALA